MKREMTCISCPIGCSLTVEDVDGEITVRGNRCRRGEIYAKEEILAPKRIVTATIPLKNGDLPRLPVRTDAPLAKELIPGLLSALYRETVKPPIEIGEPIIENYRDTGVNVVATREGRRAGEQA
jgi:CxxC motif-containing protein